MEKIILATSNKNKVYEIESKIKELDLDINIEVIGEDFDPIEDGSTFLENAYIKAYEAAKLTGLPALADDSGLVIEALNGAPGIHSARYADTPQNRIDRVLKELKETNNTNRNAKFFCAMVLVAPDGKKLFETETYCSGKIVNELKGTNGFGYDPIFYIPELNKTMAELTTGEKNNFSHRSKALTKFLTWLKSK